MARILVIDSSSEVIAASKHILEKEGYSYIIQGCENFDSGILLVRENIPDLILLDLNTSGLNELKRILYAPETATIPVIVAAAEQKGSGRIICIAALWFGARDYILKPINENDLIEKVQTQMRLS